MHIGRRTIWIGAAALLFLLLLGIAGNMLGRYTGLTVPRLAPETVSDLLVPHMRLRRPEGDGPFPAALLFSGCDGVRDNMDRWAEALVAEGWAAIVVDSHAPRGFTELQLWRLICAGQLLTGAERAGDVAVALAHARALPFVDPGHIALLGASHGGWAVLEFLSAADHGRVPLSLDRWPAGLGPDPLAPVIAAVLLYPYCGTYAQVSRRGWRSPVPVLFLLAENDAIADETACLALAERAAGRGLPVESHVYPGVTHGFDQQERAAFSTLDFDADATADAIARVTAFLGRAQPR